MPRLSELMKFRREKIASRLLAGESVASIVANGEGLTKGTVKRIAKEAGTVRGFRRWTTEEIDALRRLYPSVSSKELDSIIPGRNRIEVKQKANLIGLKRERSAPVCGTRAKYAAGCPCGACKKANAEYSVELYRTRAALRKARQARDEQAVPVKAMRAKFYSDEISHGISR